MSLRSLDPRSHLAVPAALAAGLFLSACSGGGGGGGGSGGGGVFIDTAVQGLNYVAGNDRGVTGANGGFAASPGTTVLFALGDVVIGLAPFERQLTPLSLVPGAGDVTDPTVTNIARLLQSLDSDGDPLNGIRIEKAVRDAGVGLALNFNQGEAAFAMDPAVQTFLTAAGAAGLVDTADAQEHLRSSLRGSHAGQYVGQYGGGDTGTFSVFVDRSGGLVGCAFSIGDQEVFGVSGQMELDGSGVFGNTTDMSEFEGTVGAGVIDGTWDNAFFGISGTFRGSRAVKPAFALDPAEVAMFLGTYNCTYTVPGETGAFTIDVLPTGDLDITDGDPGEVRATILSIQGDVATLRGVSDDGTLIRGTLRTDGTTSGTLSNPHDGVSGTYTGST